MMLPQGWVETQLEAICHSINYGCTSTSDAKRGDIRYIRITDIQDNDVEWNNVPYLVTLPKDIEKYELNKGDLVFARTGATVGKSHLFDALPYRSVFASYLIRVRCNEKFLCPTYAKWFFQSPQYWKQINDGAEGTGQPNFNGTKLAHLVVPLPPLAEQRRIIAKLDSLTARIARARAELERAKQLKEKWSRSFLRKLFYDLTKESALKPILNFILSLDQGWSPKCKNSPVESSDFWGVLKTSSILPMRYLPGENKTLPSSLKEKPTLEVSSGDILITRAGPRARCGVCCVVEETPGKLMIADKMYRLKCVADRAVPFYIGMMLNCPQILSQIEEMKTGISDSGLNITQNKFLSLQIPGISLNRQKEVEESFKIAFGRINRLELEAQRTLTLLNRLESSLLAKAFRGELVPQDPNDEPASVLLDRIRAERAAVLKPKRGRRQSIQDIPLPRKRQTEKHG
ncbi:restriction endonuclease subunit S [Acetobacter aceti]|uniref:restriction endonuclease subunit S n=1 Tax=Acetobacter aceti TaxID=435 RepID=UPI000C0683F3|nr:restriction endonuclease subunit S [Acetobacter aceti]